MHDCSHFRISQWAEVYGPASRRADMLMNAHNPQIMTEKHERFLDFVIRVLTVAGPALSQQIAGAAGAPENTRRPNVVLMLAHRLRR